MAELRNARAGTAGESALRVYAELTRTRAETLRWRRRDAGPPECIEAWKIGAAGERAVGRVLDRCRSTVVLHDRARPGSVGNIDHIVVGPAGVFVIDTKASAGAVELVGGRCFLQSDYRLIVNGWDRTSFLGGVRRQAEQVKAVLDDVGVASGVPVIGVLCFVGCEWRIPRRWGEARGVLLCPVWRVGQLVRRRGPLDVSAINDLAALLDCHFLPR